MNTFSESAYFAQIDSRDGDDNETFGDALRYQRRAAGLTQEELAERAGLSVRSISGWERGEASTPRRDTLHLLVGALGLSGSDRQRFEALVVRPRTPARPHVEWALAASVDHNPEAPPHNLGRAFTSFVGRERDVAELGSLVVATPLITLVGAGGVGKTRLAQELVRSEAAHFGDGAWLVELSELTNAADVPDAIAAAVGLRAGAARTPMRVLTDYLSRRHLLLVLDNCEHLVRGCAKLVADLLQVCPHLHVVATSREPLAINGEIIWLVRPLEVPDLARSHTAAQLARTSAVRLFVERASAVNPGFGLTDANAVTVARICIALDGIPLAVELAAPLTRVLSLDQISERLGGDAELLRASSRDSTPRHRTIRATVDWSYDLLQETEQTLLRRLAVFAGGWTLEMAEHVCAGGRIQSPDILDLLAQLVDKSMVIADPARSQTRFRLLAPIRQYALDRLELSGEAEEFAARHAGLLLSMPVSGEIPDDFGPQEIASLDRYESEHANIRAALRWALDHGEINTALRAAALLFRFWERRGHLREGCAWLEEALAQPGAERSRARATALNALAFLYWRVGDVERAQPVAEQALVLNREQDDPVGLAFALGNLGVIAYARDDPGAGVHWLEQSLAVVRRTGYRTWLSVVLTFLGRSLLRLNGPTDARAPELLRESLALAEDAQARYAIGHALLALGDVEWRRAHPHEALGFWHRALQVQAELADRRGMVASLERLAWGLVATGLFDAAVWLLGASDAQRHVLGITLKHEQQVDHDRQLAEAQAALEDDFNAAWVTGEASSVEEAVALALEVTGPFALRGGSDVEYVE